MNRRRFLKLFLSISSLSIFRSSYASIEQNTNIKASLLANKLLCGFKCHISARKIGYEYLIITPNEANIEVLLNHLCKLGGEEKRTLYNSSDNVIKTILREKSCRDFRNEQVVNIRGWILSKTEARLCALAMLV